MAQRPYMPLYVADFIADTEHLNFDQRATYLLILAYMWRSPNGRFPNDPDWICRKLRIDRGRYDSGIAPLLKEFCKCDGNWITQARLQDEMKRASKTSKSQSDRAKQRWENEKQPCQAETTGNAGGNASGNASKLSQAKLSQAKLSQEDLRGENNTAASETPSPGSVRATPAEPSPAAVQGLTVGQIDEPPKTESEPTSAQIVDLHPRSKRTRDVLPKEVVQLYDRMVKEICGPEQARPWPAGTDSVTADRWLEAGASLDLLEGVFEAVLRRRKAKDDKPPGTLSYFDQPVADAIAHGSAPLPEPAARDGGRDYGYEPKPESRCVTLKMAFDLHNMVVKGMISKTSADLMARGWDDPKWQAMYEWLRSKVFDGTFTKAEAFEMTEKSADPRWQTMPPPQEAASA